LVGLLPRITTVGVKAHTARMRHFVRSSIGQVATNTAWLKRSRLDIDRALRDARQ
jgi:hypothetical protein